MNTHAEFIGLKHWAAFLLQDKYLLWKNPAKLFRFYKQNRWVYLNMRPPKFLTTLELYQSNHSFSVAHTFLAGRLKVQLPLDFLRVRTQLPGPTERRDQCQQKTEKNIFPRIFPTQGIEYRHSTKTKYLQTFAFHSGCLFDVFQTAGIATVGSILIERSTGHILDVRMSNSRNIRNTWGALGWCGPVFARWSTNNLKSM